MIARLFPLLVAALLLFSPHLSADTGLDLSVSKYKNGLDLEGTAESIWAAGTPIPVFSREIKEGSPRLGIPNKLGQVVFFGKAWDYLSNGPLDSFVSKFKAYEEHSYWIAWIDKSSHQKVSLEKVPGLADFNTPIFSTEALSSNKFPVLIAVDADNNIVPLIDDDEFKSEKSILWSVLNDDIESFSKLQKDPDKWTDILGFSLLHWAASYDAQAVIKTLLDQGCNLDEKSIGGLSPLHLATVAGNTKTAALLLENGASPGPKESSLKRTPIFYASKYGHTEIVSELLARKADIKARKSVGGDPAYAALNNFHWKCVHLLLENRAKLKIRNKESKAFLLNAAKRDALEIVEFLLNKGVDVNFKYRGSTALMLASSHASAEMVRLLLEQGADPNVRDDRGRSPLVIAIIHGKRDNAAALIDGGADLNITTRSGMSALSFAVIFRENETLDLLLEKGADLDLSTKNGVPLLFQATYFNNRPGLKALINAGASCSMDFESSLPIMDYAFRNNIPEIVEIATNQCLSPDFKFWDDFPAIWVSRYYGSEDVEMVLLKNGAREIQNFDPKIVPYKSIAKQVIPVKTPRVDYPLDLQDLYGAFKVKISVIIDTDGSVIFPKILQNPHPRLNRSILDTVLAWKFKPIQLNGKSVRTKVVLPFNFEPIPQNERVYDINKITSVPVVTKRVDPVFPKGLRDTKTGGTVVVVFIVNEEGKVIAPRFEGYTHPALANAVIKCLAQWEFEPGYQYDIPVKVKVKAPFKFGFK